MQQKRQTKKHGADGDFITIGRKAYQELLAERNKYRRLAQRLQQALITDGGSGTYRSDYLRRKLDVEIRRAARGVVAAGLGAVTLRPPTAEASFSDWLMARFPEPHLVGANGGGSWLILFSPEGPEPPSADELRDEVTAFLSGLSKSGTAGVTTRIVMDLRSFRNAEAALAALFTP
jgi:hypothetical protein